jgi:hypothetical protein
MISVDDIIVLDDVICPQYQDMIESWLLSPACTWSYSRDIALADNVIDKLNLPTKPGFAKSFFNVRNGSSSDLYPMVLPLVYESFHRLGEKVSQVLFSRSFLTFPVPGIGPNDYDHIHVDTPEAHCVCLYYASDSDGDTIFFDKTVTDILAEQAIKADVLGKENILYDQSLLELLDNQVAKTNFTPIKRVTPKKGRVVMFNGSRYHTSARCTTGQRLIINTCVKLA